MANIITQAAPHSSLGIL